ncbi:hypothetical protein EUGRSUZ_L03102 [Eucalyptus grandis]|uniref:Uncharacterized protein n=1 Tax=Eucalyptus grandis TaxID=71139 RepID=A0AAD9T9A8_EUCGR|nr:hypothetical protein EUGRSUZ_L03102 [Eucalyptus grandis]
MVTVANAYKTQQEILLLESQLLLVNEHDISYEALTEGVPYGGKHSREQSTRLLQNLFPNGLNQETFLSLLLCTIKS